MKVVIGSKNPVKINATKQAFSKIWPAVSWEMVGVKVESNVSNQPLSDSETITGARNRAKHALEKINAEYGVGIEGGMQAISNQYFTCGWMVVRRQDGVEGIGSTARIITPPKMVEMILAGKELGEVVDQIFSKRNAKQAEGHFGLMTNNAITRTSGYIDGIIMALTRFIHPQLFDNE